jgi:hypothetical protein
MLVVDEPRNVVADNRLHGGYLSTSRGAIQQTVILLLLLWTLLPSRF